MDRRRFVLTMTAGVASSLAWIRGGSFAAYAASSVTQVDSEDVARGLVLAILPFDDQRFPRIDPERIRQRMYALFSLDGDASFTGALLLFDSIGAWSNVPPMLLQQENALYGPPDLAHDASLFADWSKMLIAPKPLFTALRADEQRAYLRLWSKSSFGTRRRFYRSAKSLVVAAAYSTDALWKTIGYEGPLVVRPAST